MAPKKASKKSSAKLAVIDTPARKTKLQRMEEDYRNRIQQFREYVSAIRNRKEVTAFHAVQQAESGKLATIEVTSLIAGVTTAAALGKDTILRIGQKDASGQAQLEVVFIDRIPAAPYVY